MYEVKDGSRTLKFEGVQLGSSSSWRLGSDRWIEFDLYRTENGSYVLSRVGVSLVFHGASCALVKRYDLQEQDVTELEDDATPCTECKPTYEAPLVFPEKYRHWAQVSDDPEAVLSALYKYDGEGVKYLTKVADRLLETASRKDPRIESVYKIELIP